MRRTRRHGPIRAATAFRRRLRQRRAASTGQARAPRASIAPNCYAGCDQPRCKLSSGSSATSKVARVRTSSLNGDNPTMTPAEQRGLLERLRQASDQPVAFRELHAHAGFGDQVSSLKICAIGRARNDRTVSGGWWRKPHALARRERSTPRNAGSRRPSKTRPSRAPANDHERLRGRRCRGDGDHLSRSGVPDRAGV